MAYGRRPLYAKKPFQAYNSVQARQHSPYQLQSGGNRRHQYNAEGAATLALDDYFHIPLLRFDRDAFPAPTASNNYQTPDATNGSRVSDFLASIKIKTVLAVPALLDVYEIATSFFDVMVWNTVQPTACPVTFSTAAGAEGEINQKAMVGTLINSNTIANFRFVQHYIKHKGTLEFGVSGSDQDIQEIVANEIPPQCIRSNLGMSWSLYFKFSSLKNNAAATFPYKFAMESNFMESPMTDTEQLPYLY